MASRKHIQPTYEGCSVATPGLNSCDQLPVESLPPEVLENRLAVLASQIELLAKDNHRLAASHVALKREFASARDEVHKLTEYIGSLRAEGDIQIRVLVDRITKMEVDIRAGESVKKELQHAHIEARSLALSRKEIIDQIEQATKDLEKARADVKRLPEMHAQLDSLRQEHQRLREIFEHEKGLNIEKVQRMQNMEKEMVAMDAKLEKLRSEVLDAEKKANAPIPYGTSYVSPPVFFPPAVYGNGEYVVDQYPKPPPPQMGVTSVSQGIDPFNSVVIPPPLQMGSTSMSQGIEPFNSLGVPPHPLPPPQMGATSMAPGIEPFNNVGVPPRPLPPRPQMGATSMAPGIEPFNNVGLPPHPLLPPPQMGATSIAPGIEPFNSVGVPPRPLPPPQMGATSMAQGMEAFNNVGIPLPPQMGAASMAQGRDPYNSVVIPPPPPVPPPPTPPPPPPPPGDDDPIWGDDAGR